MITEPHNLRHLFLQIDPIKREFCLPVFCQPALRIVDRIASENEQVLDPSVVYVRRQLQNTRSFADCAEPARTTSVWPRFFSAALIA